MERLLGVPCQLAEPDFEVILEGQEGGEADLTLRGTMFQGMGASAEKAHPLDAARDDSLTDGVLSMPLLPERVRHAYLLGLQQRQSVHELRWRSG